jgi:hypothetical protein
VGAGDAANVHGAPALAPQPIASILSSWYLNLDIGVTGAVYTLAAAMFISGLAVVGSVLLSRRQKAAPKAGQVPQSEPA